MSREFTKMVCGFGFYHDEVLLIKKDSGPPSIKGRWNGLGGKVEDAESSYAAMSREFEEESGIATLASQWVHFATFVFANGSVDFLFHGPHISPEFVRAPQEGKIHFWDEAPPNPAMHVDWLLSLAVSLRNGKTVGILPVIIFDARLMQQASTPPSRKKEPQKKVPDSITSRYFQESMDHMLASLQSVEQRINNSSSDAERAALSKLLDAGLEMVKVVTMVDDSHSDLEEAKEFMKSIENGNW